MRLDIDPRLPYGKSSIQIDYARELFHAINASGDRPKNDISFEQHDDV